MLRGAVSELRQTERAGCAGRSATRPDCDATPPCPPTDAEKYAYLSGSQKRWLFVVQLAAVLGVAVSYGGFATSSYYTMIFCFPLALLLVEQCLATYTSTFRRTTTLASHREVVARSTQRHRSVSIFVPTAGEDLEILANTLRYAREMAWEGPLQTWVLDDSGRSEVRHLAESLGVEYLCRRSRLHNKAGNLQYGYERTDADFIVILDADFAARSDLLQELMPYFEDGTVGIVQSPQYFSTSREMPWLQRAAGATQELFYRFIQPSRDHHQAAICVGSSAVYRRVALSTIGGFPLIGHSEDVFTGLEMTRRGFAVKYVPVILSRGLCPDNVDKFIAQQYRWCEGSVSLLASRVFHVATDLPLRARMSYWAGFLYYIGTAATALLVPLPAIIMVWAFPEWVRPANTVWLLGMVLLWFAVYPTVMHGRWRPEVLRVQVIYGFAHLFSIVHFLSGETAEWQATGNKSRTPIGATVRHFYQWYLGSGAALLLLGFAWRCLDGDGLRFAPMLVFTALNLYVVVPLIVPARQIGDIERFTRSKLVRPPRVRPASGTAA